MADTPLQPARWDETVELEELIESSGLAQEEVLELVELGVLECDGGATRLTFVSHTVIQARRRIAEIGADQEGLAQCRVGRVRRLGQQRQRVA